MLDLEPERGELVELPQRNPAEDEKKERPRRLPRRPDTTGAGNAWQATALFVLCLLLLASIGLAYYSYRRSAALEGQLQETVAEMQAGMQELKAGVEFDATRKRLLLGIRDEILRVNDGVSLGEAYGFAELLMASTDKYPSVDPVLLLSVGIIESGFDSRARSTADARGLYQIWPSTGRMLSAMLGWEYSDEMLYDARRNTEMAALYLDVLMTTYNDVGMALAEYNGGPVNAGYYRAGSHRGAAETRDYVPKVLGQYERLVKILPTPPGLGPDIVYRDAARPGKRLGVARAD